MVQDQRSLLYSVQCMCSHVPVESQVRVRVWNCVISFFESGTSVVDKVVSNSASTISLPLPSPPSSLSSLPFSLSSPPLFPLLPLLACFPPPSLPLLRLHPSFPSSLSFHSSFSVSSTSSSAQDRTSGYDRVGWSCFFHMATRGWVRSTVLHG